MPEQCRGARAMLNMKRDELSRLAEVAMATLADFETGKRQPHPRTLAAIRRALEDAGVRFTERGVELADAP
ncbi:helix-turn-helix domain-containing protein [Roseospira goensis]|uniref:Transcriptional regulator with XRE-family HTH domain n=1 Tax=Roseospira goensis TaxID=391922 RepID=A0A7W6S3P5_9PROT|nr:helix-turn-helix transcriptional regulator [Roseospira goensis]MBB4287607.1 transcriptional regulator with XRE-family HTH domain [Roseospira goensis]